MKKVTNEDISILKKFGLTLKYETLYQLIDLKSLDSKKISYQTGIGNSRFLASEVNADMIENILKKESGVTITLTKSTFKFRDFKNVRVVEWHNSTDLKSKNFDRICMMYSLYKKYRNKIKLLEVEPRGIKYENERVSEINDYLKNFKAPVNLYVQDLDGKIVNTGKTIYSAKKIEGTGKADIALLDENGNENYWMSYKFGNFYKKNLKDLDSIPFQQYGSLSRIYSKTDNTKVIEMIESFSDKVVSENNMESDGIKNVKDIVKIKGNFTVFFHNGETKSFPENSAVGKYMKNSSTRNQIKKFLNNGGGNIYFYNRKYVKNRHDFLNDDSFSREDSNKMAGMSIYGINFEVKNNTFGRENVNILIQTRNRFVFSDMTKKNSVLMQVDDRGHILFNPNTFNEKYCVNKKGWNKYTPVMSARYDSSQYFIWKSKNSNNLMLNVRFLVLPLGKA